GEGVGVRAALAGEVREEDEALGAGGDERGLVHERVVGCAGGERVAGPLEGAAGGEGAAGDAPGLDRGRNRRAAAERRATQGTRSTHRVEAAGLVLVVDVFAGAVAVGVDDAAGAERSEDQALFDDPSADGTGHVVAAPGDNGG